MAARVEAMNYNPTTEMQSGASGSEEARPEESSPFTRTLIDRGYSIYGFLNGVGISARANVVTQVASSIARGHTPTLPIEPLLFSTHCADKLTGLEEDATTPISFRPLDESSLAVVQAEQKKIDDIYEKWRLAQPLKRNAPQGDRRDWGNKQRERQYKKEEADALALFAKMCTPHIEAIAEVVANHIHAGKTTFIPLHEVEVENTTVSQEHPVIDFQEEAERIKRKRKEHHLTVGQKAVAAASAALFAFILSKSGVEAQPTPDPGVGSLNEQHTIYLTFALKGQSQPQLSPSPTLVLATSTEQATVTATRPISTTATVTIPIPSPSHTPEITETPIPPEVYRFTLGENVRAVEQGPDTDVGAGVVAGMGGEATMYEKGNQVSGGEQVSYVGTTTIMESEYPGLPPESYGMKYHVVENSNGERFTIPISAHDVPVENQKAYEGRLTGPTTNLIPEGVYATLHAENDTEQKLDVKVVPTIDRLGGFTIPLNVAVNPNEGGYGGLNIYSSGENVNSRTIQVRSDGQNTTIEVEGLNGSRRVINLGQENGFQFALRLNRGTDGNDYITILRMHPDGTVGTSVESGGVTPIFLGGRWEGSLVNTRLVASSATTQFISGACTSDFRPIDLSSLSFEKRIDGGQMVTGGQMEIGLPKIPPVNFARHNLANWVAFEDSFVDIARGTISPDQIEHDFSVMKVRGHKTAIPATLNAYKSEYIPGYLQVMMPLIIKYEMPVLVQFIDSNGQIDIDESLFYLFPGSDGEPPANATECLTNAVNYFAHPTNVRDASGQIITCSEPLPVYIELGEQIQTQLAFERAKARVDGLVGAHAPFEMVYFNNIINTYTIAEKLAQAMAERGIPAYYRNAYNGSKVKLSHTGSLCRTHTPCAGVQVMVDEGAFPGYDIMAIKLDPYTGEPTYNLVDPEGKPIPKSPLGDLFP